MHLCISDRYQLILDQKPIHALAVISVIGPKLFTRLAVNIVKQWLDFMHDS